TRWPRTFGALRALPRKRRPGEPGHGRERDRLLALSPVPGRLPGRRGFLAATTAVLTALLLVGTALPDFESIAPRLIVGLAAVAVGVFLLVLLARRSAAPARELLQDNVASLERTNRELVEARAETIRAARLASVGTLAAGIAHEVGNPLGAIIAYVDVARTRARRGDTNLEILDSIREEADRIHRIVRGLLDYARPGEQEVAPRAPAEVVYRVRELLEHPGRSVGGETRWEVSPVTPLVTMDPHRLEQVLVNLIMNALDAMSEAEPRRLTLRVYGDLGEALLLPSRRENDPPGVNYMHRRRISRDEGGIGVNPVFVAERVVVLEVWDSGPGSPAPDLRWVFDPLFTTKKLGHGTGLGLAICARRVEGMGGGIEAKNAPDGGARFIRRLPAADHAAPSAPMEKA